MAFVKISPKDVRQRQFKKGFTGFDPRGRRVHEVRGRLKSCEHARSTRPPAAELIADLKKLTVLKVKKIFGGKEKGEDIPPEIKKDVNRSSPRRRPKPRS